MKNDKRACKTAPKETAEGNCVVSFRINREEKNMIDRWARKSGLNTSSVLRAMFYALQGSVEDVIGKYKAKENFKRIDR